MKRIGLLVIFALSLFLITGCNNVKNNDNINSSFKENTTKTTMKKITVGSLNLEIPSYFEGDNNLYTFWHHRMKKIVIFQFMNMIMNRMI